MENHELYHYGVLGMKWGIRKLGKNELRTGRSVAKDTSEALRSASNIAGNLGGASRRPSKKVQDEISSMSDQELRNRINRMNLERQYADLSPSKVSRGASYAKTTLEVAGSVAAIAGSALSIALAIKQLRGN